jgi:predicted phage terminase large subunit-like protein
MSRLNNKKEDVVGVIMQRLHEKDLTGHILEQGGYEHLCLPAECEKKTFIDIGNFQKVRKAGEYLHPEREGEKEIAQRKKELGAFGYSGQYMQSPTPIGGGMIKKKWIPRYSVPLAHYKRIIQSWDTSYKPQEINDPSVCTTWGEHDQGWDLLHVYRDRIDYPELKRMAINMASQRELDGLLIEDKASGQSLIQELRQDKDFRIPVIAIEPEGDKLTRLATEALKFESGMVRLPEHAEWLPDYENELFKFPLAETKDQVDSTSQFLRWAGENGPVRYEYEAVEEEDEGAW